MDPQQPTSPQAAQSQPDSSPHQQAQSQEPSQGFEANEGGLPDLPQRDQSERQSAYGDDEVANALNAVLGPEGEGEEEGTDNSDRSNPPALEVEDPKPDKAEGSSKSEDEPSSARRKDQRVEPTALARFHREKTQFFQEQQKHAERLKKAEALESVIANGKHDPLAALEAMGYEGIQPFIDRLAQDGGRETPERKELREMKEWRKSIESEREQERQKAQEFEQNRQIQAQIENLRSQVKTTINDERYANSVMRLKDADQQVMLEMDRIVTETGEMPDIGQAIESVSKRMRGNLEELASNPEILEFFKQKLGAQASQGNRGPQSKQRQNPRTIGNNVRNPGLQHRDDYEPTANGEQELQDAIAYVKRLGY